MACNSSAYCNKTPKPATEKTTNQLIDTPKTKLKVRNYYQFLTLYPDRESNAELSLRRTLLYPFNYQGLPFRVQRYE